MASPEVLTPREREVLIWVGRGLTNSDIAEMLNVTPKTVEFHLTNVYTKLRVRNRTQAVVRGLSRELIALNGARRHAVR